MSDNLNVRATLSAIDHASPVIAKLLANVKQLENVARRFNASFAGIGNSKMFNGLSAQLKRATDEVARSADSYKTSWDRAYAARLSDAKRMHAEITRLERQFLMRRQAEQRAMDREYRSGGGYRSAGLRGPSATSTLIAGGITFSGVASAFRKRMETNVAETKAQIFGGLSSNEVKKLRGDWSDQVAIRFGESAGVVLDAFTESLKQGFGKNAAKKVTENALEAASALEMDIGQLMKLSGKVATSIYGDVSKADPARVARMMTSVAVAAAATAADPDEVVEANKRAMSALSTTRMKEIDLSAFTSVGISVGLQANKTGTFLGFLTSELSNAGNARGQRAKDLNQAAQMLGYGNRAQMAQRMASVPTEFMLDMFTKMQGMSEQNRAKFANLAGMREWRDELVQMAKAVDQIRATLKEVEKIDSTSAFSKTKMDSIRKRFDQMKTAFGIAWEKFGEGFEETFIEISDWFRANANSFAFDKIKEKSKQLVDGLKKGFGITDIKDSIDNLVSRIQRTDATKAVEFIQGFAEGLGSVFEITKSALKGAASIFGDGDSARGIGKFVAQFLGFAIVLRFLAPVVSVLGSLGSGILTLVRGLRSLGGMFGTGSIGTLMAGSFKTLGKGIAGGLVMKVGEILLDILFAAADWVLGKIGINRNSRLDTDRLSERGLWQKLKDSFLSNEEFKKKYEKRSESREVGKAVGEEIKKSSLLGKTNPFVGNIQPASFTSGSGGGFSYASQRKGISLNGTPLHHAVPGQKLPSFGLGSNGIIRRDNIPSFSGTGGSMADGLNRSALERKFAGTPLAGKYDQVVAAAKANNIPPSLLAGIIAHETGNGAVLSGNNVAGLMDPSTGHSKKMKFAGLDDGIAKAGQVVAKNYRRAGGDLDKMGSIYAPPGAPNDPRGLNGGWPAGVRKNMQQMSGSSFGSAGTGDAVGYAEKFKGMNEYTDNRVLASALGGDVRGKSNAWCARFVNKALAEAGGKGTGSAVANSFQRYGSAVKPSNVQRNDVLLETNGKGYNQTGGHVGLATGETRMRNGRMQIKMISGNDSDSVRERWIDADDPNLMVRRNIANVPQGITDAVPASGVIQNVPPADPVSRGLTGPGMMRGGSGAQIHINGNSHDPEALATLVQRRINESMNWRTHDTASEYT